MKELVKSIKRAISIDWSEHDVIKAKIRSNVRLMLLRNDYTYEEADKMVDKVYKQAFYLYKDYPAEYTQA